ncbi:MAG: hypothetical protein F6K24_04980 [Okeania sp. SIO2D1]|nr:hypothetical protein [Okeania sp. SIO2D1]
MFVWVIFCNEEGRRKKEEGRGKKEVGWVKRQRNPTNTKENNSGLTHEVGKTRI